MRITGWAIGPACGLTFLFCAIGLTKSQDVKPSYPAMAPIAQYRVAPQSDEIALARSAAPMSISGNADVLTLGSHGYEKAVKGKKRVCLRGGAIMGRGPQRCAVLESQSSCADMFQPGRCTHCPSRLPGTN